ncbi:MAG: dienelactone hydrolase family protein [Burkholderiales bacterium]|nr:dienelactone hydrolase family protein [Burkholderiales bacterium]
MSVIERAFVAQRDGHTIPGVLWLPAGATGRAPLMLISHGGGGHKKSKVIQEVSASMVARGFAAAAIDGPMHGERRAQIEEGPPVQGEFVSRWKSGPDNGGMVDFMIADWKAALDHLVTLPEIDGARVGWNGLSMGTAFGLPFVAAEPRIKAAVLGLWGLCFPMSERLGTDAPQVACPVYFQLKWNDELFTRQGQLDLFDKLGTADKRLKVYMGKHAERGPEQRADAEAFLVERLAGS